MENASKALLIAGGVLLVILLLTLMTYLFGNLAENSARIYQKFEDQKILEFNQQFLNYDKRGTTIVGYEDDGTPIYNPLTIQEVATLINLAQDNNKNPKYATTIAIYKDSSDLATVDYNDWLNNNKTSTDTYNCKVHINDSTLVVDYVLITKHTT